MIEAGSGSSEHDLIVPDLINLRTSLYNVSNQDGANSVTAAPCCLQTSRGCSSLRKLHFSKIIWWLALGFLMDLRLNTTRRSINLSVYLVFDLEAGRFKFLGENLLDTGRA